MSITTELREAINQLRVEHQEEKKGSGTIWYMKPSRDRFSEIADRIDKEHERELTMARGEAIQHLGSEVAKKYVQLPLDAEGVPFRVGDVVEQMFNDKVVNRGTIERITFYTDDFVDIGTTLGGSVVPTVLRHAQADTFGTIISDAVNSATPDIDALVKRCERVAARQVGGNEG